MPELQDRSDRLSPEVWKVVVVAAIGSFLALLDSTVVNVSLASLAAELHTPLATMHWVTSGYLLALALMLPMSGWLVERIGAKKLYLLCFTTFTLCSALCALSWSAGSLIGFRVLQGISGGLMAPLAQLTMARAAGRHMVRVVGYASVPVLLGPLLGPVLAGAILQHASWRWLFLINLPVGVVAVTLAALFLPRDEANASATRELDLKGFLLLSPALVSFLYGVDHLASRAGAELLALALLLFTLFYRRAHKLGPRALIDLELFRGKVFPASAVTQFTLNGLTFSGQMLIPMFLIRAVGVSPSRAGWLLAPLGIGMMFTYPSLGRITKRYGLRATSAGGATLGLLSTLPFLYLSGVHFSVGLLTAALLVRGAGMGAVGVPSMSAAYASVRHDDLPMASATLNIVQRIGGPTLTTLCATVLGWRMAAAHSAVDTNHAFTAGFLLLCGLHALLVLAALRLPKTLELATTAAAGESGESALPLAADATGD